MKIGINATSLNDRPSGAKNRFIGIYKAVFKKMHMHSFVIYQSQDCDMKSWFEGIKNISLITVPCKSTSRVSRFLAHFTFWKAELSSKKFDLLESLHQPIIKNTFSLGATVSTIYDVRGSKEGNCIKQLIYRFLIHSTLRNSDLIITISNTIKNEILSLKKHPNIKIVGCGIENKKILIDEGSKIFREYIKKDFILSVGHLEDRKNYHFLVKAFSALTKDMSNKHLVIVGNDNGGKASLKALIETLQLTDKVTMLENITDQELATIYHLSKGVIFPSFYEGFGIPILETMIYEKPLILSNINVFHEITESNAVFFNPNKINEIKKCMQMIFTDPNIFLDYIEYGKKRVKDFAFEKLASDTCSLFESYDLEKNFKR